MSTWRWFQYWIFFSFADVFLTWLAFTLYPDQVTELNPIGVWCMEHLGVGLAMILNFLFSTLVGWLLYMRQPKAKVDPRKVFYLLVPTRGIIAFANLLSMLFLVFQ